MAMDFIGLSVGMGYTDETVIGGGALKGENCVVSNIEEVADGVNVTFQWTLDDGTVKTDTAFIPRGTQGEAGVAGKSAYEIWLEAGNTGSEEDFLNSLKGESDNAVYGITTVAPNNGYTDCDDFPQNTIIAFANATEDSIVNLPIYGGVGQVMTFSYSNKATGIRTQLYSNNKGEFRIRTVTKSSSGSKTVTPWSALGGSFELSLMKSADTVKDANDFPNRSIVAIASSLVNFSEVLNLPKEVYTDCNTVQIITMCYDTNPMHGIRLQICHDNLNRVFYRTGVLSSSGVHAFTGWTSVNAPIYFNCENIVVNEWANKRICIMGDSLTAGVSGVTKKWYNIVSAYIDTLTMTSVAKGGSGYINTESSTGTIVPTFGEQFDSINTNNYDAFIVMGGVNDSAHFTSRGYSYDVINDAIISLFTKLNNTRKPVLVILPPQSKVASPILTEICKLIYDNIHLIDKGDIINMNWFNNDAYYLDSVHLNDGGQTILGKTVASLLK